MHLDSTRNMIGSAVVVLLSLAGCRNNDPDPARPSDPTAQTVPPGTGAGNSTAGMTGGTATTPGSAAATVPGVSDSGAGAVGGSGTNATSNAGSGTAQSGDTQGAGERTEPPSR